MDTRLVPCEQRRVLLSELTVDDAKNPREFSALTFQPCLEHFCLVNRIAAPIRHKKNVRCIGRNFGDDQLARPRPAREFWQFCVERTGAFGVGEKHSRPVTFVEPALDQVSDDSPPARTGRAEDKINQRFFSAHFPNGTSQSRVYSNSRRSTPDSQLDC